MKKVIFSLVFVFALLFFNSVVSAQELEFSPEEMLEDQIDFDVDELEVMEEVDQGPHFRGGEFVVINGDLIGDVYVGAGEARVEGTIDGDLLIGAGQVTINGVVTKDLRIGAGQVTINGDIYGNVSIGAGTVTFSRDSFVAGNVVLGSGQAVMDGKIDGQVYSWAGKVEGNGMFGRNIQGATGKLILGDGAQVQGDISFQTDDEPIISEQAMVNGRRDIKIIEEDKVREKWQAWENNPQVPNLIFRLLMTAVSAGIVFYFFPNLFKKSAKSITQKTLATLGWGTIVLIVLPVVVILLFVTVLGIPLAVLFLSYYLLSMMMAGWVVAFFVGEKIAQISKLSWLVNPYLQILLGAAIMLVLTQLPIIGGLISLMRMLLGLGAIWLFVMPLIKTRSQSIK